MRLHAIWFESRFEWTTVKFIEFNSISISIKLNSKIGLKFTQFEFKDENTISFSKIVVLTKYNLSIIIKSFGNAWTLHCEFFCLF